MVKSSNVSKRISTNMVPLIVSFFAGFIVNRLMNHQDVITGDVTEGMPRFWIDFFDWVVLIIGGIMFLVGFFMAFGENRYLGLLLMFGGGAIMSIYWVIKGLFDLKNSNGQISGDGWDTFKLGCVLIVVCLFIIVTMPKDQ